jgi:hypothetical protein
LEKRNAHDVRGVLGPVIVNYINDYQIKHGVAKSAAYDTTMYILAALLVGAVVLNVTVTQPTSGGYITVYPTGTLAPTASSLNFTPGQNIANLVTAKVGTGGQVAIYNYSGNTQVLFDVVGWFPNLDAQSAATLAEQAGGGEFVPLVPDRILDTRSGIGAPQAPLGPNGVQIETHGYGFSHGTAVASGKQDAADPQSPQT